MPKPSSHHQYVAGKGSWRRPSQVSEKTFSENWDAAFGKKPERCCEPVCALEDLDFDDEVAYFFCKKCGRGFTPIEVRDRKFW